MIEVFLALLAFVAVVVVPIWAFAGFLRLKTRVATLERKLERLSDPNAEAIISPSEKTKTGPWGSTSGPPSKSESTLDSASENTERVAGPEPHITPAAASFATNKDTTNPSAATRRYFVFSPQRIRQLRQWLIENWFILIAAVSLALAGVFFVQYGIENGLLPPPLRVLAALALGVVLIIGGEFVRRKLGDDHDLAAFLPSAFSGAGIVSIMAGILSARQLYDLIGPTPAFAGIVATAIVAIGLGWFYGPFLIAFGTIGATVAPFLVGGSSPDPWPLYYYFALIAVMAMSVDAVKRTAWITVIAIIAPTAAASLLFVGSDFISPQHAVAFGLLLFIGSASVPPLSIRPLHSGVMITETLMLRGRGDWPEFPTRVAFAGGFVAIALATVAGLLGEQAFWIAIGAVMLVFLATVFWLRRAIALQDIALYSGLVFVVLVCVSGFLNMPIAYEWQNFTAEPESNPHLTLSLIIALSLVLSVAAAYAALDGRHFGWVFLSGTVAPLTIVALDQFWDPLAQLSRSSWALHAIAVAALMTVLAIVTRRRTPDFQLLTAIYVLAAMTMIAFACIVLLSETALTLALAGLAVSAAWLDRRYKLMPLTLYIQIAALASSWRLILDPGIPWASDAPISELILGFGGTSALLGAAWLFLSNLRRRKTQMIVESVAVALTGIGASLILARILEGGNLLETSWSLSLIAIIWILIAAAQYHRVAAGFVKLRKTLAAMAALIASALMIVSATIFNPMLGIVTSSVDGPPIFDSLALAYLCPATLIFGAYWYFRDLNMWVRRGLLILACALTTLWAFLEIRRIWRGTDLAVPGFTDAELYSHTISLILLAVGLIVAALLKKSDLLRKVGLAAAAVAVAKVFLIDISGLTGLIRVFSFLALGLSLAGLAMVNRWIIQTLNTKKDTGGGKEEIHPEAD